MGSTASSKAVKKTSVKVKKDSGTKKSVRKAAPKKAKSRATPVKKKAAGRKKAAAPKKATSKKTVARKAAEKKRAPRKKASTRAVTKSAQSPEQLADATVAGTTPAPADAPDTAQGDPNSLSWMAAQAASALKAVRANQNERAQDLLAKAEITPATPVKAHQEDKTLAAPDVPESKQEAKQDTQADKTPTPVKTETKKPAKSAPPETKKDKKTDTAPKPVRAVAKQVKKASPAVVPAEQTTPDKTPSAPSAPVAAEPTKQGAVQAAASRAAPAQPEAMDNAFKDQQDIPPAHVIAATSKVPGKRRPKRLILLTGIIVVAGVLGARIWFSDNDTADIAAVQDSAGTEQVSPVTAKPSIEVITSVASEPPVKPATAATQTNSGSPTTHPAQPEPPSAPETLPTVAAMPPETAAEETVATGIPVQQATTQTTAAAPQFTKPAAPQPAYYAPAYGYYQQQRVRQQPYYRPGYSR
jgi:hypothetical protein